MIRSIELIAAFIAAGSFDTSTWCAPSARASADFESDVVTRVTSQPSATPSFTAMCPSPPRPTTPRRVPGPVFQRFNGEYVVMPAQSSGATRARSARSDTFNTNSSRTTTDCE